MSRQSNKRKRALLNLPDDEGAHVQAEAGIKILAEEREYINKKVEHYEAAQTPSGQVSEQIMKECVSELMRHMLAANYKDPNKPIKKEALSTLARKLQGQANRSKQLVPAALSRAQAEFTKFGFEMVQVPHGASQAYILRSLLPRSFIQKYVHPEAAKAMDALKAACLTFIHLKGGKCTEDELWSYLSKFGLYRANNPAQNRAGSKEHPAFGMTPTDAITALIAQRMLALEKDSTGEATLFYRPGDCAIGPAAEMGDAELKAAVTKMMAA